MLYSFILSSSLMENFSCAGGGFFLLEVEANCRRRRRRRRRHCEAHDAWLAGSGSGSGLCCLLSKIVRRWTDLYRRLLSTPPTPPPQGPPILQQPPPTATPPPPPLLPSVFFTPVGMFMDVSVKKPAPSISEMCLEMSMKRCATE